MARQPRLEFPGALHHVMSRGNDGIDIFRDEQDRLEFLSLLAAEVVRSRWILHDYCLMTNHYHLSIETPECTLSTGMHHLLGTYVRRFNKRHGRRGHLFENRFKSILVDSESYFLGLSRYIVLNPVDARIVNHPEEYEWSSYSARLGLAPVPSWLTIAPVMSAFGPDEATQRTDYRKFVEDGIVSEHDLMDEVLAQIYLGSAAFIERIQKLIDGEERSEEHPRAQVHPGRPAVEDVIEAVAQTFDRTPEEIVRSRGTLERPMIAYLAFEDGLIPLRKIARALGVTSAGGISTLVESCRRELVEDEPATRARRHLPQTNASPPAGVRFPANESARHCKAVSPIGVALSALTSRGTANARRIPRQTAVPNGGFVGGGLSIIRLAPE